MKHLGQPWVVVNSQCKSAFIIPDTDKGTTLVGVVEVLVLFCFQNEGVSGQAVILRKTKKV